MSERYFITGVQLGMISALVRRSDPPFFDVFAVCDVLKDIEYTQFIGNMPEPYEDYEIAIVSRRTATAAPDAASEAPSNDLYIFDDGLYDEAPEM